jgi:excisionase family DNA binding protein
VVAALSGFYNLAQINRIIGIDGVRVRGLSQEGIFPLTCEWYGTRKVWLSPKRYVDGLANDLALMRSFGSEHMEGGVFILFFAAYSFHRRPPGLERHQQAEYSKPFRELCDNAVVSRDLITLATLKEKLADYVKPTTVDVWHSEARIVSHRVGVRSYVPDQHARQLEMVFSLPRVAEAAGILGVSDRVVVTRIRKGSLKAFTDPTGIFRVDISGSPIQPEILPQAFLTPLELANKLRVSDAWVYERLRSGEISSSGFGPTRRIPLDEVERLKDLAAKLNAGFTWLEELLIQSGCKPNMCWASEVCRELQVSPRDVTMWARANLLPYCVLSKGPHGQEIRQYPRLYIQGLRRAIGDLNCRPLQKKEVAIAYQQKCHEARRIV